MPIIYVGNRQDSLFKWKLGFPSVMTINYNYGTIEEGSRIPIKISKVVDEYFFKN